MLFRSVADLDVPGDDLGLGNAFADVGQLELVFRHQSAITFSSAFFMADGLRSEMQQIEQVLRSYEADIGKLQSKLREARARQNAIAARIESAVARAKAREMMHGSRTLDAFAKFEVLERRADFAEGRAEALGMTGPKSLEEEIAELRANEKVDAELEAMKAALAARIK